MLHCVKAAQKQTRFRLDPNTYCDQVQNHAYHIRNTLDCAVE